MQERVGWGNGVKDHFRILEFWRIFAAFMVMVFHFLNYGPPAAVAPPVGVAGVPGPASETVNR